MSAHSESLIVAVDGGGSNCRAAVFDRSGQALGRAVGGSANITTNFDEARRNVIATISAAYRQAGLDPSQMKRDVGCLGLAGANIGAAARNLEACVDLCQVRVLSDRSIAIQGALGSDDGTVAQIGTGSFFSTRRQGQQLDVGGWGFQLSDDCSGASLGRKLLRASIAAYDGLGPSSPLTDQILERFDGTPNEMVTFALSATPRDFGAFAIKLVEAWKNGDAVAMDIFDAATKRMVVIMESLGARTTGPICLLGGLGPTYRAMLPEAYSGICAQPKGDALDGAFSLGRELLIGAGK